MDSRRPRKTVFVAISLLAFAGASFWFADMVSHARGSTAPLLYILLPLVGGFAALSAAALTFSLYALLDARAGRIAWTHRRVWLAAAILLAPVAGVVNERRYQEAVVIARNPRASAEDLADVFHRWIPWYSVEIRLRLAENPATPPSLLELLLNETAADSYLANRVANRVGAHPNALPGLLERITSGPQPLEYDRVGGVAGNPNITPAIAAKLASVERKDFSGDAVYSLYQSSVLARLGTNPATPPAVFDQIASGTITDEILAAMIIQSPRASCPQIKHAGDAVGRRYIDKAKGTLKERGCPTAD